MNIYTIKLFDIGDKPLRCETLRAEDYKVAAAAAAARLRNSRFKSASIYGGDHIFCRVGKDGFQY